MKKIFSTLLISAAAASFTACSTIEDDFIFDKSAAERLNEATDKYSNLLTKAPYGWAFEYYPTGDADDGALLYALKFSKDGTVTVAGDPYQEHNVLNESSLWDIILDQGPVLSFSTYNNLIHMWADPLNDGEGYMGDYEFSFVYDENEDPEKVVMLRGKKRGLKSRLKMIDENVTPEEYLLDVDGKMQQIFPPSMKNYALLNIGEDVYRLDGMSTMVPEYYPFGTDPIFFGQPNSYLLAKYDGKYEMRYNYDFYNSDSTLVEKNFFFDAEKQEFVGVNGNARITPPVSHSLLCDGLLAGDITGARLLKSCDMSDSFKALWTAAENALKSKNYTLNESVLSIEKADDTGNCTITLKYKPRTGTAVTLYYLYNISKADDKVTLSYVGPYNTGAANMLTNIPDCEKYIKAFAGTYTISNPSEYKFDVAGLKFTSVDDASKSFVMNITFPAEAAKN